MWSGVACATGKVCGLPAAPRKFVPAATLAVSVQVPAPTYDDCEPVGADHADRSACSDVTDLVPSPFVVTVAVKLAVRRRHSSAGS